MPERIQLIHLYDGLLPVGAIAIYSPSPWQNPFIAGIHGTERECVERYENLMAGYLCWEADNGIAQRISYQYMLRNIQTIQGKDLACWCPPDRPCHGNVLIKLANPNAYIGGADADGNE